MKIYAYYLEDERIHSVGICEDSKLTDQELVDKVKELNEKEGREAYKLFDIPECMDYLKQEFEKLKENITNQEK